MGPDRGTQWLFDAMRFPYTINGVLFGSLDLWIFGLGL